MSRYKVKVIRFKMSLSTAHALDAFINAAWLLSGQIDRDHGRATTSVALLKKRIRYHLRKV
jgi:hypothetical protein